MAVLPNNPVQIFLRKLQIETLYMESVHQNKRGYKLINFCLK